MEMKLPQAIPRSNGSEVTAGDPMRQWKWSYRRRSHDAMEERLPQAIQWGSGSEVTAGDRRQQRTLAALWQRGPVERHRGVVVNTFLQVPLLPSWWRSGVTWQLIVQQVHSAVSGTHGIRKKPLARNHDRKFEILEHSIDSLFARLFFRIPPLIILHPANMHLNLGFARYFTLIPGLETAQNCLPRNKNLSIPSEHDSYYCG